MAETVFAVEFGATLTLLKWLTNGKKLYVVQTIIFRLKSVGRKTRSTNSAMVWGCEVWPIIALWCVTFCNSIQLLQQSEGRMYTEPVTRNQHWFQNCCHHALGLIYGRGQGGSNLFRSQREKKFSWFHRAETSRPNKAILFLCQKPVLWFQLTEVCLLALWIPRKENHPFWMASPPICQNKFHRLFGSAERKTFAHKKLNLGQIFCKSSWSCPTPDNSQLTWGKKNRTGLSSPGKCVHNSFGLSAILGEMGEIPEWLKWKLHE